MKKKLLLIPILMSTSVLLAACGDSTSKEAKNYAKEAEYVKAIEYLNAAISAKPTEEKYQKELAEVKSEYAQALINKVIDLQGMNTSTANQEALKLLNIVIELDPLANENLFVEKEKLEKTNNEQIKLDEYAVWLNKTTQNLMEVLKTHRLNSNALSEGTMNIQEFAYQTTVLQNKTLEILQDAELQMTKTTGDLSVQHNLYREKIVKYYETFRAMVATVYQNEIQIEVILKDNLLIHSIPADYIQHVQALNEMAKGKNMIFPENIDPEAYKEFTEETTTENSGQ